LHFFQHCLILENKKLDLKSFEDFLNLNEEIYAPLEQSYKLARHLAFVHPYSEFMACFFSVSIIFNNNGPRDLSRNAEIKYEYSFPTQLMSYSLLILNC
jgi:hypothetical protein